MVISNIIEIKKNNLKAATSLIFSHYFCVFEIWLLKTNRLHAKN